MKKKEIDIKLGKTSKGYLISIGIGETPLRAYSKRGRSKMMDDLYFLQEAFDEAGINLVIDSRDIEED